MSPDDIIKAGRKLVGSPFMHQGRIPEFGLDCAGLMVCLAESLGYTPADMLSYGINPSTELLLWGLDSQPFLTKASIMDRRPGDILVMRFRSRSQHLALFTGSTIIHAYYQVSQVAEHNLSDEWLNRISHNYRFKDIDHG